MALDRYGQKFNENMRGWMNARRTEHPADVVDQVIDALTEEAQMAMQHGYQPWDAEWQILRNTPPTAIQPLPEEGTDVPITP